MCYKSCQNFCFQHLNWVIVSKALFCSILSQIEEEIFKTLEVSFWFGHCPLLFYVTESFVSWLGHNDDASNKCLPISATLKFAQKLIFLTSGLPAQNVFWVGVSFNQCVMWHNFLLKVFKPWSSFLFFLFIFYYFFNSKVFRAFIWEQKRVYVKSSNICSEIFWNWNYINWCVLALTLSGKLFLPQNTEWDLCTPKCHKYHASTCRTSDGAKLCFAGSSL